MLAIAPIVVGALYVIDVLDVIAPAHLKESIPALPP